MKGCAQEGQQNFRILLLKKHQNKIKKLPDDLAVTQRERDHRDPPIRQSPPQPFPCFAPPLPFSLSNQSQVKKELLPEFTRTSASIAVCVNQLRNKSSAGQHTHQVWSLCKIIHFIFSAIKYYVFVTVCEYFLGVMDWLCKLVPT